MTLIRYRWPLFILLMALVAHTTRAFLVTQPFVKYASNKGSLRDNNNNNEEQDVARNDDGTIKKNLMETLMDPKPTTIPPFLKDEIYKAESNTQAAKDRKTRINIYSAVAVVLLGVAFGNVFLTELRNTASEGKDQLMTWNEMGLDWVESNFLWTLLFSTKIGGILGIVGGAGSAMMVEAEMDSERENAEKIYQELARRRKESQVKDKRKKNRKKKGVVASTGTSGKKKKQSGTQKKRLAALSEVILDEQPTTSPGATTSNETVQDVSHDESGDSGGLMGKMKEMYEKADSMAASSALILNKELEDRGIVDKITDETGLKVVGKEAAAKEKSAKENDD